MASINLAPFFEERYAEIETYLLFLQNVEDAARAGAPRFRGTDASITPDQKKILNSSLYLQLYNLVEATVLRCLESVVAAIEEAERRPSELSLELRTEWVRSIARTHSDLGPDKRLDAALDMCEQLLQQIPVKDFRIEPGGGGNWDDLSIEKMCERVGCGLNISPSVFQAAKRHVRDDMGALKLVKNRRNGLAHGSLSFVDCSDGVTVAELKGIASAIGDYLREAVTCFVNYVEGEIAKKEAVTTS
ncbi:hypothetical protein BST33_17860 [Mycolicibacter minnesotensis]|uniref:MAE-28990/MAE-18760-like HEPN domain-containing protein n=1 Tax=Mycolicibacter minnesotensis TaxID=1118379 RepID=A0A7I7R882_9MYCO|nr:MAE_28990/MAE_18760 family HEPN-like nuclease [Mycolicibacter minnesotensis]ORA97856.1 hypothetical protein BST33_17860 [Mycolicibacter minnesotensis]BBY34316.1 hypothetical protein MMIN_23770 [Mycolicibacter minnesotensis]